MSIVSALAAFLALPLTLQEPAGPPSEVEVQVALLDVFRIDGAEQSVELDFLILLRWKDGNPGGDPSKGWNPELQPVGARGTVQPSWTKLRREPDGRAAKVFRYTGAFPMRMQLRDFPLDAHTLRFQFVVPGASPETLRFLPGGFSQSGPGLNIVDWQVGAGSITVDPVEFRELGVRLAAFSLDLPVRRRLGYALWGVMLPIFCIIAMAWSIFWLPSVHFGHKMGISTTAILTLIAYRFVFASMVPKLPYLTRMDQFLVGATILIFAAFLEVVVEGVMINRKQEERVERIDRHLRWIFPGMVAAVALWSFVV